VSIVLILVFVNNFFRLFISQFSLKLYFRGKDFEIASEVDESPYAYYFQQARNGVYIRQAIISKILGLK